MNARSRTRDRHIRRNILLWYRRHQRDLVWRTTRDPYQILVSEVMLQQTQVSRVQEKLPVFLRKFPTLHRLARADTAEAVRAWEGLGYNNRAVRLRDLARIVTERRHGILPSDPSELIHLPGIGPYTSHALACFAFGKRVPLVDTNVRRLFSRLFWRMKTTSAVEDDGALWKKAGELLPRNAYRWNQAIMDFGALICTATSPACGECPVASYCRSRNLPSARNGAAVRTEPLVRGLPRRIWRGKIVQILRSLHGHGEMTLRRLGRDLWPDITQREFPRLERIVRQLEKDGIVESRTVRGETVIRLERS